MSETKNSRWKILTNQLRNKYRLVILNDNSFAEKFSLRLSPLSLIILFSSVTVLMTALVISLVAFTPLREYIPGYASSKLRKDATELALKSDSLTNALKKNEAYQQSIIKVLNGDLEYEKVNKDSILASDVTQVSPEKAEASKQEIALRKQVTAEEKRIQEEAKSKKKK